MTITIYKTYDIQNQTGFFLLFYRVCCLEFFTSFFASRSTISIIFLLSRGLIRRLRPSDLADDVKLSLSVSKLRLKVRNGSLLKVVAPRCGILALIFRAVAFQHFILVQSRYLLSFQLLHVVCLSRACSFNFFRFSLFLFHADISDIASDFAGQKIELLEHYINSQLVVRVIITFCQRF